MAAVAYVERYTGRYFGAVAEIVETLDGSGADVLWLRETPAATPAILVESRASDTWETVDLDDHPYETDGRQLYLSGGWTYGRRNVRVTYTAGYAAGEEPADIRQVVMELVAKMYQFRTPVVTGTIVAEIPHGARDTLNRWRRIPV
jgi:hypothetical protein